MQFEMEMDDLDRKLNETFDGKVVRKDLLHRIKKGTNVPTFVLEFLLARYCASNEPAEIQAGMEAVLATLDENYVRPDEANAAQSRVATKGKHKFIDKVHVRYVEKDKRHWAALENFGSQKVAIAEKFYRDTDRLLEGGIWAEVTIAHNDIDEDKYAFYVEDLRPIQLTRFNFDAYCEGRGKLSRDEWLDAVLRTVGLEPEKLSPRLKLHFIARLAPLAEANFNFVELGPRGTGKSYFFSEFSPYSTLISGGQATKATLFYNNARGKIGLVGFWDTVAFDEVGGIKIKDPDTIQIMKDFMANGRFSRGVEIIANASMAFVGNIDQSIQQIVRSVKHDLFLPLPPQFDLAVMDRFACYLPGWEMPKTSSAYLTDRFGLITDYLAEAFHYQLKHNNRYEEVSSRLKLGNAVEGRDEKGIKKTLCAFLKILHPEGPPSDEEFFEYAEYAIESRRRIKEQMNKRKPDDEFALINLSYFNASGQEIVVHCPETKGIAATLEPDRRQLSEDEMDIASDNATDFEVTPPAQETAQADLPVIPKSNKIYQAPASPPSLEEIITADEGMEVEYKSTFQWDVVHEKKNTALQKPCLKTIAAFLNTKGGTLVIGVNDDKEVLGLEEDLKLTRGTIDQFERTFRQVMDNTIGASFAPYCNIRFIESQNNKQVCIVEVERSKEPSFLHMQNLHEFFIRSGNATKALSAVDQHHYIKQHFS